MIRLIVSGAIGVGMFAALMAVGQQLISWLEYEEKVIDRQRTMR